jgi:hypothetical protein
LLCILDLKYILVSTNNLFYYCSLTKCRGDRPDSGTRCCFWAEPYPTNGSRMQSRTQDNGTGKYTRLNVHIHTNVVGNIVYGLNSVMLKHE